MFSHLRQDFPNLSDATFWAAQTSGLRFQSQTGKQQSQSSK
jgi:hypothetical protein